MNPLRSQLCHPLIVGLLVAAGAGWPRISFAQTPTGDGRTEIEVELGGRTTWADDEAAKFLEYRDLDEGVMGAYRLLLEDREGRHYLRSQGHNLGFDDQRYWLEAGRYGRFKLDLFFRELPHVFSTDARTLYTRQGDDYRLPAGLQAGLEAAPDRATQSALLGTSLSGAGETDVGFRWLEAGGGLEVRLDERLRLHGSYRIQDKLGTRPQAIDWGTPGGNFVVFPLKVDEKIHEVRTGAELTLGDSSVSLEYLGSFFDNELREAIVDNPLIALDAVDAASRGRQALSPDNAAHSLSLSGMARLPLAFPARLVGSLVYGIRLQDQSFLPHTINGVIPSAGLALPQGDLDGKVQTWLGNLVVNLDPRPGLDVDLRYRVYRYDNDSDELLFAQHVTNDDALETSERRSVTNDYTRHRLGLDARYVLSPRVTGHLGYGWEYWQRSSDRQVSNLNEHGPTAKLDYRPAPGTSLQLSYEFRTRNGDSYDPFAYFDETLDEQGQQDARDFGELRELRKYDQADRDRHHVGFLARALRGERLELSASGGLELSDYRNTDFGLTDELGWNIGGEAYYQLNPRLGVSLFYDFEASLQEQDARWRPRRCFPPPIQAVDDPLNDWSSRTRSRFHTGGMNLDIALIPERLDLQLGYEFHHARERTTTSGPDGLVRAGFPPATTSGDGGDPSNFPEIEETLQALSVGLIFHLSERVSLEAQYRYEDYDLDDDFRRQDLGPFLAGSNVNGDGAITPSTDVFLADELDDYQAHVLWLIARLRF